MSTTNKILLKIVFVFLLLIINCFMVTYAQDENLDILNKRTKWSNRGGMLINKLNKYAYDYLDLRDKEISKLKTKSDWIKRQRKVKEILMRIVGPFPGKTPLNPKITGVLQKNGYRVEKIIIETMPKYYLTGCLFIPDGIVGKRPAIIDNIGHSGDAFRKKSYQNVIHNLVKKGFIVFAIDPVQLGERDEYFDPVEKKSVIENGVPQHTYSGNQCYLSGFSVAKYHIWDGIRAVDYLLTREEVDPGNIGATGLSGGGTVTSYLCAFEDRIKAYAPYNWAIYNRRLLEAVGVQDAESNIYHGISEGITYPDFIESAAPRPVLLVKSTRDYLPIQGARESYQEIKKAYKAFGKEENLQISEDDDKHTFTRKNNEATYAFFQKHLNLPGDPTESEPEYLTVEELTVTPTGQISTTYSDCESVFSLNKKESEGLIKNLETSRKNITEHLKKVKTSAISLSGYSPVTCKSEAIFCGRYKRNGYSVELYTLSSKDDYVIPMLLFVPDGSRKFPAVVYLHPDGKSAQASVGEQIEELVKKGFIVAAPDLLGIGETTHTLDKWYKPRIFYTSVVIGKSMVGVHSENLAEVVNYLITRDDVESKNINGLAIGKMCPALIHSAAFNQSINNIALLGSPISYRTMVINKYYLGKNYDTDLSLLVAGALSAYDLPDLIGCIAPRKVVLADLKNQMLEPASTELINQEMEFPRKVYSFRNADNNLIILPSYENLNSIIDRY
ncbi:alpha/beta hydrolase family protein [candidate division KSB1 bacterium]